MVSRSCFRNCFWVGTVATSVILLYLWIAGKSGYNKAVSNVPYEPMSGASTRSQQIKGSDTRIDTTKAVDKTLKSKEKRIEQYTIQRIITITKKLNKKSNAKVKGELPAPTKPSSSVKGCAILNKSVDTNGHDKYFDPRCAFKILKKLQESTKHLWGGWDPRDVYITWPGLLFDGEYMLREFIDTNDTLALGMRKKPQSIDDMTDGDAEDRFYQLVNIIHLQCADMPRIGNTEDGGWKVCVSGPYKPQRGCIVYSIGINNDFTFDDSMGKMYGCQVNSYDPSMRVISHKRSKFVYFHKVGLGIADSVDHKGWRLMSLKSIIEHNGHAGKIIDFLKIDIEFNEWDTMEVILERGTLKNVKQLALEIHSPYLLPRATTKFDFLRFYTVLLNLEKQGFRRYFMHRNKYGITTSYWTGKMVACCHEIHFININYMNDI